MCLQLRSLQIQLCVLELGRPFGVFLKSVKEAGGLPTSTLARHEAWAPSWEERVPPCREADSLQLKAIPSKACSCGNQPQGVCASALMRGLKGSTTASTTVAHPHIFHSLSFITDRNAIKKYRTSPSESRVGRSSRHGSVVNESD